MKTIKVKYLKFGNADAIINEDDFDPELHALADEKEAKPADPAETPKKRTKAGAK